MSETEPALDAHEAMLRESVDAVDAALFACDPEREYLLRPAFEAEPEAVGWRFIPPEERRGARMFVAVRRMQPHPDAAPVFGRVSWTLDPSGDPKSMVNTEENARRLYAQKYGPDGLKLDDDFLRQAAAAHEAYRSAVSTLYARARAARRLHWPTARVRRP